MTRRELREHIFLLVFRSEFHSAEEMEEQLSFYFDGIPLSEDEETDERFRIGYAPQGDDIEVVKNRYFDLISHKEELDKDLSEAISGWKLERVGKVERAILRLALYEMRYDEEVPEKVAINEAVELAKKFGADASAGFVNGVLAKFTKNHKQEEQ